MKKLTLFLLYSLLCGTYAWGFGPGFLERIYLDDAKVLWKSKNPEVRESGAQKFFSIAQNTDFDGEIRVNAAEFLLNSEEFNYQKWSETILFSIAQSDVNSHDRVSAISVLLSSKNVKHKELTKQLEVLAQDLLCIAQNGNESEWNRKKAGRAILTSDFRYLLVDKAEELIEMNNVKESPFWANFFEKNLPEGDRVQQKAALLLEKEKALKVLKGQHSFDGE